MFVNNTDGKNVIQLSQGSRRKEIQKDDTISAQCFSLFIFSQFPNPSFPPRNISGILQGLAAQVASGNNSELQKMKFLKSSPLDCVCLANKQKVN